MHGFIQDGMPLAPTGVIIPAVSEAIASDRIPTGSGSPDAVHPASSGNLTAYAGACPLCFTLGSTNCSLVVRKVQLSPVWPLWSFRLGSGCNATPGRTQQGCVQGKHSEVAGAGVLDPGRYDAAAGAWLGEGYDVVPRPSRYFSGRGLPCSIRSPTHGRYPLWKTIPSGSPWMDTLEPEMSMVIRPAPIGALEMCRSP